MDRRSFLKKSGLLVAGAVVAPYGSAITGKNDTVQRTITILHTNDIHGRWEPFPVSAGKWAGKGGINHLANRIDAERRRSSNLLLLDAGDFISPVGKSLNGRHHAKALFKAMKQMGYDAIVPGNAEFSMGREALANQVKESGITALGANYFIQDKQLKDSLQTYRVFEKGGVKIGVFGIGAHLKPLVKPENSQGIRWRPPEHIARAMVRNLKKYEQCDLVICLSHLGFSYGAHQNLLADHPETQKMPYDAYQTERWLQAQKNKRPARTIVHSDLALAESVPGIDLIIGGHTHHKIESSYVVNQGGEQETLITQTGAYGLQLGKIEVTFQAQKQGWIKRKINPLLSI